MQWSEGGGERMENLAAAHRIVGSEFSYLGGEMLRH